MQASLSTHDGASILLKDIDRKSRLRGVTEGIMTLLNSTKVTRFLRPSTAQRKHGDDPGEDNGRPINSDTKLNTCKSHANQMLSIEPTSSAEDTSDTILVSRKFLLQVAHVIALDQDLEMAVHQYQNSKRELVFLQRRLQYVNDVTEHIITHLNHEYDQRPNSATSIPEENRSVARRLVDYGKQLSYITKVSHSVESEAKSIDEYFETNQAEHKQLRELAAHGLSDLLNQDVLEDSSVESGFEFQNPVDLEFLEECMDDCDNFMNNIPHYGPIQCPKYPSNPTKDWHIHYLELNSRREKCEEAKKTLAEIEAAHSIDGDMENPELDEQEKIVASAQQAVTEAVEAVRFAGISCKSTGSLFSSHPGSPQISTYDHWVIKDDEMDMTQLVQRLEQSQSNTEHWLSRTDLDQDPDQVGPLTPCTPATIDFGEKLRDVLAEDSVSNVEYPESPSSSSSSSQSDRCSGSFFRECEDGSHAWWERRVPKSPGVDQSEYTEVDSVDKSIFHVVRRRYSHHTV